MNIIKHLIFLIAYIFVLNSTAQTKPIKTGQRALESSKSLEVNYGNNNWNGSAKKIDSAFAYIKDKTSGKVVKVVLDETEPDSSTFSGKFSINLGNKGFTPQVYIPPLKATSNEKKMYNFNKLLREGKIKRKPLLMKKTDSGGHVLDIYDTKEQVLDAAKAYQEEKQIKKAQKSKVKPIADKATIEAARLAHKQAMLAKLALEASQREQERLRKEQLEKQRIENLREKQKSLASAEKKRRIKKARLIAAKALVAYNKGKYTQAEKLFRKSSELDPNNDSFIYKYAVSLYRNGKYNQALVLFKLSKTEGSEDIEKKYFMGLTHYRLKEIKPSLEKFNFVKTKNHPILSPSSAFYAGMIQFGTEKYKPAKDNFEYVLDTSKDPKMDQRAEDMIEKIARIQMFKNKQQNPNTAKLVAGLTYDSNVLFAADTSIDQGTVKSIATPRYNITGAYERRFIYTQKHEFNTNLSSYYEYSQDAEAAGADAFLNTVSLPYKYKGKAFNKGYLLKISPGYEVIFMGADSASVRENILNTVVLNIENTFVMHERWFAAYTVDLRNDDSKLTITTANDNADAQKITLSTTQTYFLDKSNKKGILSKLGIASNNATGADKTYTRMDLGVTYIDFIPSWDSAWTAGLSYYNLAYKEASSRTDNNFTLLSSVSKPFKTWTGSVNASYVSNQSSVDANTYSKYTVMATATWEWIF